MKEVFYVILIVCAIAGVMFGVITGINNSEATECFKWQGQAKQFPGFYLTNWQKGQCDAHSITIDAPVVGPQQ